ncbi:type II secretion system secretin GspD [Acidovorax kalamii]|uniref:Type II secretion system protein GspD n=1 Tax=Acidovorax kalamii TaxID=2004485 RepID=A0A235EMP0_9BURK|nr:type II secretion system secretin GspD [Acidovorax kalamii]OYD50296.1 type II secretion system protein GspD [Acidovorax kalamii]
MIFHRFGHSVLTCAALHVLVSTAWAQPAIGGGESGAASSARVVPPPVEPRREESIDAERQSKPRIFRGNDQVVATARPATVPAGGPLTFSFEDAPVADVVRTVLGDIMGVPYVMHPPIAGTVTLASRSAIPPDQAVFLLESALQANGLALARDARGTYHVGRADMLRNLGSDVRQASPRVPLSPGFGAIVIPLNYIGAGEMAAILRPMVPGDAIVRVDTVRNLLVMSGTRTQAEGWLELVNTFDVDLLKGMSVGVFPLKHASVKDIEAALRLVGGGGGASAPSLPGTGAVAQAPRTQAPASLGEGNPLFGALRIMPIESINSILVVTPRASYLDEARRWIERLDQPSDNGAEAQLHIFKVQNGNARHLASVLSGIFGGASNATSGSNSGVAPGLSSTTGSTFGQGAAASAFGNTGSLLGGASSGRSGTGLLGGGSLGGAVGGRTTNMSGGVAQGSQNAQQVGQVVTAIGNIRVMADELNNAVLVWGTRGDYLRIEATLKRLDLPPTQVLIEATIVEVTLGDNLNYGVQWGFKDSREGSSYTGAGNISSLTGGDLGGVAQGFSYILRNGGTTRAVLRALSDKSQLKVISSPSLMVLDNHTAAITVGNQQPIRSATTANDTNSTTTSTIQYKDTGVGLTVTPSVNSGNLVTMQVDQAVTEVGDAVAGADGQPAFLQRQISSKVAVRSGESIVLGGLIRDNSNSGKTGVPILQDIPLVGKLFGTNRANNTRTELLVVLTPRVVRSDIDIREVSEDLRDRLKGLSVPSLRKSAEGAEAKPPASSQ